MNSRIRQRCIDLHAGLRKRLTPLVFLLLGPAVGLSLATGCTMHLPAPGLTANAPETKIIDLRPALVRKALLRVLSARKFNIDPRRSTPQSVQTEWLQDGSFRSMIAAEIKPLDDFHTELAVKIRLEKKTFWGKSWEPSDRIDESAYSEFMNAVQLESYRILYDGG